MGIGGIKWLRNISEKDVGGRKLLEGKYCDATKIFSGRRTILSQGRSGVKKNVCARKIFACWRREIIVKQILLLFSFMLSIMVSW